MSTGLCLNTRPVRHWPWHCFHLSGDGSKSRTSRRRPLPRLSSCSFPTRSSGKAGIGQSSNVWFTGLLAVCLLGSAVALASLSALGDTLFPSLLVLSVGVWVGHHVQNGRNGVSYVGTQFVLGLLITLVQGPGPITHITPGLERFVGILIGVAADSLLILSWPLTEGKRQ
jgi:hypothetical protein